MKVSDGNGLFNGKTPTRVEFNSVFLLRAEGFRRRNYQLAAG